jgi:CDP-6-deoxy-D-xylo-4-hexulose-3-dehydrase
MYWKLQENVVTDHDLDDLVTFIRNTKRFTQFEKVREFERRFAEWQGCRFCVFVNSGSSANLLLINAVKELLGWQSGDEVIVPAVTWPTTVTPVMQCGLTPVFVDANLTDLSLDYEQLAGMITDRTRAIFLAHLLGFPADVDKIRELTSDRGIAILEDCCESQGATLRGRKVGNLGLAGTFSFYWGHHMTSVEGGMVCTGNEELFKLLVLKRSHGLARELPSEYHSTIKARHPDIDFNFLFLTDGMNVRNTEFNAVLGLCQLRSVNDFIHTRNANYTRFAKICKRYPNELITLEVEGVSSFALPFLFRSKSQKHEFRGLIQGAGIETRPLISGNLLRQPFLQRYYNIKDCQNADFLHTNAFYVGNNQFVGKERMQVLEDFIVKFFHEGSSNCSIEPELDSQAAKGAQAGRFI